MAAYSSRVKIPFAFSKTQGVFVADTSGGSPTDSTTVIDPVVGTNVTVTTRTSAGGGNPATVYQGETGTATWTSLQTNAGGGVDGWVDPGSYRVSAAPQGNYAGATAYFEAVRGDGVTLIAPGAVGPQQIQSGGSYQMDNLDVTGDVNTQTLEALTATIADLTAGEVITDTLAVHNEDTSLPSSAIDGEIAVYQADPANGVNWQMRYNAHSSSNYKWEFIGGSTYAWFDTQSNPTYLYDLDSSGTGTWTTPAAVTLPLAGDYEYVFEVDGLFPQVSPTSWGLLIVSTLALHSGSTTTTWPHNPPYSVAGSAQATHIDNPGVHTLGPYGPNSPFSIPHLPDAFYSDPAITGSGVQQVQPSGFLPIYSSHGRLQNQAANTLVTLQIQLLGTSGIYQSGGFYLGIKPIRVG